MSFFKQLSNLKMLFNRPPLMKLNTRQLTALDCRNPLALPSAVSHKKWFVMTPCLPLQEKALFKQERLRLILDFSY